MRLIRINGTTYIFSAFRIVHKYKACNKYCMRYGMPGILQVLSRLGRPIADEM